MKINTLVYLSERYRMLTEEQQAFVDAVLTRGLRDCMRWADRARSRATHRTSPWSGFASGKALAHAGNAGALRIARDMLRANGCVDDRRDRVAAAKLCDQCSGHGRVICECVPTDPSTPVEEMVGEVDCELCRGDGDFACPVCYGSGAVLNVETPSKESEEE